MQDEPIEKEVTEFEFYCQNCRTMTKWEQVNEEFLVREIGNVQERTSQNYLKCTKCGARIWRRIPQIKS